MWGGLAGGRGQGGFAECWPVNSSLSSLALRLQYHFARMSVRVTVLAEELCSRTQRGGAGLFRLSNYSLRRLRGGEKKGGHNPEVTQRHTFKKD